MKHKQNFKQERFLKFIRNQMEKLKAKRLAKMRADRKARRAKKEQTM